MLTKQFIHTGAKAMADKVYIAESRSSQSRSSRLFGKKYQSAMAGTALSVRAFIEALEATILPCAMPVRQLKIPTSPRLLLTFHPSHCRGPALHWNLSGQP